MSNLFLPGTIRGMLLGDGGYPAEPWLMPPFINPQLPEHRRFNYKVCFLLGKGGADVRDHETSVPVHW